MYMSTGHREEHVCGTWRRKVIEEGHAEMTCSSRLIEDENAGGVCTKSISLQGTSRSD